MQAAGGAPVAGESESQAPRRPTRALLLLVVGAGVLLTDLASKLVAVRELSDRAPIELLGGALTLRLVRNPGAAFGLGQGLTVVLTAIAVVVVVMILRVSRRLTSAGWAVALGLVLGGALGNLVDRLFRAPGPGRGEVVDFLELPRWPVFNVADSAIVAAAGLMVLLSARGVALDGSPAGSRPDAPAAPGGGGADPPEDSSRRV